MEKKKTNHLDLERDVKENLRLFLMFVKNVPIAPLGESVAGILAFRVEDAIERATRDFPNNHVFYGGQSINVTDLLNQLNTSKANVSTVAVKEEDEEDPVKFKYIVEVPTKEQFINNLRLVKDRFIEDPEKQKTLEEIINSIR